MSSRSVSSRPHWMRYGALASALSFTWSLALALPAQALTHQPPAQPPIGLRHLTLREMQAIRGQVSRLTYLGSGGG